MANHRLANLALMGLLGTSVAACGGDAPTESTAPAAAEAAPAEAAPAEAAPEAAASKYKDVHGCAGANTCKGLGGCKVTEERLAKLAEKRGISMEEAGEAHSCAGMNACKGLGGCHVTQERFDELKAQLDQAE